MEGDTACRWWDKDYGHMMVRHILTARCGVWPGFACTPAVALPGRMAGCRLDMGIAPYLDSMPDPNIRSGDQSYFLLAEAQACTPSSGCTADT